MDVERCGGKPNKRRNPELEGIRDAVGDSSKSPRLPVISAFFFMFSVSSFSEYSARVQCFTEFSVFSTIQQSTNKNR